MKSSLKPLPRNATALGAPTIDTPHIDSPGIDSPILAAVLSQTSAEGAGFHYGGSELALFEKAQNWKRYWRSLVKPFISGDVLEVGAGIGSNAELLREVAHREWTCLEPDAALAARIAPKPQRRVRVGTLASLTQKYDAILYIDVLEHIEDDRAEMARAAEHLWPGGALIVLAPAHAFLFTPVDTAIGHFRRYSKDSLRRAAPPALRQQALKYVDSVGLCASLGNRLLLKQAMPTERQILAWDRLLVPPSRVLDRALGYRVGKSVLGVWRRA